MEEVADEIPDLEPAELFEEVEEIVPEPPVLKRQSNKKAATDQSGRS